MSWQSDEFKNERISIYKDEIKSIHEEIKKNENFFLLFEKYKNA
jgi:hypothetical protein